MPQTSQNKVGVLFPNSSTPIYDSIWPLGNRGASGPTLGSGPVIHVAKTGNDSSGTGAIGAPYLTINKAMSVATEGCTIRVRANGGVKTTYIEDTIASVYVPDQYFFDVPVAVGVRVSGTISNRCTIMAYPGDESLVVIDGNDTRVGIHTNGFDYWNIYGLQIKNCQDIGIANMGQVPDHVPDLNYLSTGVIVENCYVANVHGLEGGNISGIGCWGSKDWIIRNTYINGVSVTGASVASAIQSYGAINLLVENIETNNVQYGIFEKDHFLVTDTPRTPYKGMEVRYCKLNTLSSSIHVGIRGSGSCEAGNQYVHHNIMYGYASDSEGTINIRMLGAAGQSKKFVLNNNTIDISTLTSAHIVASNWEEIENEGNIFCGGETTIYTLNEDYPGSINRLTKSNRNVYTDFRAVINTYSSLVTIFETLPGWQAAVAGTPQQLGVSNPDINSVEAAASGLFINRAGRDYNLAPGSAAIGIMANGSNGGAYQYGTETIGLLPTYTAGS